MNKSSLQNRYERALDLLIECGRDFQAAINQSGPIDLEQVVAYEAVGYDADGVVLARKITESKEEAGDFVKGLVTIGHYQRTAVFPLIRFDAALNKQTGGGCEC